MIIGLLTQNWPGVKQLQLYTEGSMAVWWASGFDTIAQVSCVSVFSHNLRLSNILWMEFCRWKLCWCPTTSPFLWTTIATLHLFQPLSHYVLLSLSGIWSLYLLLFYTSQNTISFLTKSFVLSSFTSRPLNSRTSFHAWNILSDFIIDSAMRIWLWAYRSLEFLTNGL